MNEEKQIKIIELIDDGATLENSTELKEMVDSSEEAKNFYESLLISESALQEFFGGDNAKEFSNKIDNFVAEQFKNSSKVSSTNFKPIIGFAFAASLAVIGITLYNIPSQVVEPIQVAYEEPQVITLEESAPLFIAGDDLIGGLWGPATELANEIGRDRYEIMYAVFKANKEGFVDNNINQPKNDRDFFVDLSLVENLDPGFVIDEVKRHIFCSC